MLLSSLRSTTVKVKEILVIGHQFWVFFFSCFFFLFGSAFCKHNSLYTVYFCYTVHRGLCEILDRFWVFIVSYCALKPYSGMGLCKIKQFSFLDTWQVDNRQIYYLTFPLKNYIFKNLNLYMLLNILSWRQIFYLGNKFLNNCLFFFLF